MRWRAYLCSNKNADSVSTDFAESYIPRVFVYFVYKSIFAMVYPVGKMQSEWKNGVVGHTRHIFQTSNCILHWIVSFLFNRTGFRDIQRHDFENGHSEAKVRIYLYTRRMCALKKYWIYHELILMIDRSINWTGLLSRKSKQWSTVITETFLCSSIESTTEYLRAMKFSIQFWPLDASNMHILLYVVHISRCKSHMPKCKYLINTLIYGIFIQMNDLFMCRKCLLMFIHWFIHSFRMHASQQCFSIDLSIAVLEIPMH